MDHPTNDSTKDLTFGRAASASAPESPTSATSPRPGDRIGDVVVHESRTNIDALMVDKHLVQLGPVRDAMLCLQGGALRAVYTAGVLDAFLDVGLAFKDVVGVSAGTLVAMDYVCGARGAAAYTNLAYAGDPRYVGLRDLLLKHQVFNFDFMFGEVADYLMPFEARRFHESPMTLTAIASNLRTARPAYFRLGSGAPIERVQLAATASCSMPGFSKVVHIDGEPYLDGGVTDPLGMGPALEAIDQGRKVVFVSTRERGYRKGTTTRREKRMYRALFARWPGFAERLCEMNENTDDQMRMADELAAQGRAFVLHPVVPPTVTHTERDTAKLRRLYEQGIYEARCQLPALMAFLDS